MIRRTTLLAGLLLAGVAHAETKICVVDAETAINETTEGKQAQSKLEGMYSSKQTELKKLQEDFEREVTDYDSRKPILSDAARQTEEERLMKKQQELQMKVMQAEQEMQQTYMELLAGMEAKLIKAAEKLGADKGCTVLLQRAAVIYMGSGVVDLTSDLVKAYDGK